MVRGIIGPDSVRSVDRWARDYNRGFDPRLFVGRRVHDEHFLAVPSNNNQALIGAYTVPTGMYFVFKWLVQVYIGSSSWTPGDGNIIWVLDIDIPLTGTQPTQGMKVNGWQSSRIPYGGYNSGLYAPWELEEPEIIEGNSILRSKVTINSANITTGQFVTIFGGSQWPRDP